MDIRRFLTLTAVFLCIFSAKAYAYEAFDTILDGLISEKGVFDGNSGIIYAAEAYFGDKASMLVVSVTNSIITCEIYDNSDGIQCTDIFNIPYSDNSRCTFSLVTAHAKSFIMLKMNSDTGFYTVSDDTLTQTAEIGYSTKNDIVSVAGGKITAHKTKRELYNFLNALKKDRINAYEMPNIINTLSDSEKNSVMKIITACADVMDFDIREYDYDKIVKYILCSNQNFQILTDIPPEYVPDSGGLSIVSTEYIDYIITSIFALPVKHPSVNLLTRRGYCVDNGYYYYKNSFGFYATDILDAEAVYDIGNDMYYIIFSDIFRFEGSAVPEYSYAVLKKSESGYGLVKLGMGRSLLFERELYELSPTREDSYVWENSSAARPSDAVPCFIAFMVLVSCGAAAGICFFIYTLREISFRKNKK